MYIYNIMSVSATDIQCCFCGPVRNCASFLSKVLNNIETLGSCVFQNKYAIIVFYDKSNDKSLDILQKWRDKLLANTTEPIIQMHIIENPNETLSKYRTHRIAFARNKCLDMLNKMYPQCPYFIMMDFDDPNSKSCSPQKLMKYFDPDKLLHKWDSISFQTSPHYYDIWAVSIAPFGFSYNHLPNNQAFYGIIQKYLDNKLSKTRTLVPCISAFNGFAIYKSVKFKNCHYSGDIRASVKLSRALNPRWIEQHKRVCKAKTLEFHDYGNVDGKHEDCEHRVFHMQGMKKHGARIRISPENIFG
jgi:hypothetical protein